LDDIRIGGDGGEIVPSGGEDANFDLHTDFQIDRGQQLSLSTQIVHRPKVYRSYRPNQVNRNERRAVSLRYQTSNSLPIADKVTFTATYQYKEDERKWLDAEKVGVASWKTLSFDLQSLRSTGPNNLISWGLQYRADIAESADDEQFTIRTPETGEQKASPDTYWGNIGAYIMDELEIKDRFVVTGSVRLDQFHFSAEDNVFYTIPGSTAPENVAIRDPRAHDKVSVTGGLGLVCKASSHWNLVSSWNRGYRLFAPNFGLRQLGYGLLGPNSLLDPVVGDAYELSVRCRHSGGALSLTAYYTDFGNFQHPVPGSYEGETTYDFDGNGRIDPDESVFIVAANGDAYVEGVELEGEVDLGWIATPLRSLTMSGGFMWNYGRLKYPEKEEEPLRHTHPARAITKLRWTDPNVKSGRWLELSADMVRKFDQVSESRLHGDVGFRVDPQDANSRLVRDYGLPGYSVFDIRGGMDLLSHVRLVLALENILDKRYRTAHSRMDASGMNFQVGLEVII
jgi:outer membrane receptor protein involved in Fe transport